MNEWQTSNFFLLSPLLEEAWMIHFKRHCFLVAFCILTYRIHMYIYGHKHTTHCFCNYIKYYIQYRTIHTSEYTPMSTELYIHICVSCSVNKLRVILLLMYLSKALHWKALSIINKILGALLREKGSSWPPVVKLGNDF